MCTVKFLWPKIVVFSNIYTARKHSTTLHIQIKCTEDTRPVLFSISGLWYKKFASLLNHPDSDWLIDYDRFLLWVSLIEWPRTLRYTLIYSLFEAWMVMPANLTQGIKYLLSNNNEQMSTRISHMNNNVLNAADQMIRHLWLPKPSHELKV